MVIHFGKYKLYTHDSGTFQRHLVQVNCHRISTITFPPTLSCNSVTFCFKLLTHSIFMLVVHFIIQLLYVSLSLLIFFCNHPRIGTNYFNSSHYNMLVHLLFFFNGVMFIQPLFFSFSLNHKRNGKLCYGL